MSWVASNPPPDPRTYAFKAWLESAESYGRGPMSHARTPYYIALADAGTGDGSSEANAKGCANITAINAVITAQGANKDFLLKRGETYQGTTGVAFTAAGQGIGAWGTGDAPMLTGCWLATDVDDGGGWSGPSSGVYTITLSGVTMGNVWVRSTVPASGEAIDTDKWYNLVTSAPTAEGEFQVSGSNVLVYPRSGDTIGNIAVCITSATGIGLADVDNLYVRDVDIFGHGFNQSGSYCILSSATSSNRHYVANCRGDGTSRHVFGAAGVATSGGILMMEGCTSGSVVGNGSGDKPTAFVQYRVSGDHEMIVKDCWVSGGVIPVTGWIQRGTAHLSHIGTSGAHDLCIFDGGGVDYIYGWDMPRVTEDDIDSPSGTGVNDYDPANYRSFVVDYTYTQTLENPDTGDTSARDNISDGTACIWRRPTFYANCTLDLTLDNDSYTTGESFVFRRFVSAMSSSDFGGWLVNCTITTDASGTTADIASADYANGMFLGGPTDNTATALNSTRFEHCHWRHLDGRLDTEAHWAYFMAYWPDSNAATLWNALAPHQRADGCVFTCDTKPPDGVSPGFENQEVGAGGDFGGLRNCRFHNVNAADFEMGGLYGTRKGYDASTTSAALAVDLAAEYTSGSVTADMLIDNNVSLGYDRTWNRRDATRTAAGPVAASGEGAGARTMGRGTRSFRGVR